MPLRFESIIEDEESLSKALEWAIEKSYQNADSIFTSKDGMYVLFCKDIYDYNNGTQVGKIIVNTRREKENNLTLLDMDFVLCNNAKHPLNFEKKMAGSSDENEYYEVSITDGDAHFCLETVNRHVIEDSIEGKTCSVYLSAMPYKLSIFDWVEIYDQLFGFGPEGIKVAGMDDYVVNGLSETFISPEYAIHINGNDSTSSFVAGIIKSYQDVRIRFGDISTDLYVIIIDSAVGELPVAVGKEVFDTDNIAVGKILGMFADIKADFAGNYYYKPLNV